MNRISRGAFGATALLLFSTVGAAAHPTPERTGVSPHSSDRGEAASEATTSAGALRIEAPWTRATPGGAKVASGYVRITNTGQESERLIGASMPLSERANVHQMSTEGGVMKMRPLEGGLEIKPGETVELKPGGYHLMFMDLHGGLREGDTVKGTMVFERAGRVPVEFRVGGIGAGPPGGEHTHH